MGLTSSAAAGSKDCFEVKASFGPICKDHAVVRNYGGGRLTSIISPLGYRDKERREFQVVNFWILVPIFGCLILESCSPGNG